MQPSLLTLTWHYDRGGNVTSEGHSLSGTNGDAGANTHRTSSGFLDTLGSKYV